MIKRTQHSLKFITAKKREMLDKLFVEYQRVVNEFIGLYWNEKKLASKATATQWRRVTTWLCGKAVKCAYRQAIQIIKTTQDRSKKRIYKAYQRVFAYAKKKNKPWAIVTQKWSEWSVNKKFRDRVKFPVFNGNSIDLNSDLVTIYESPKMKEFDLAVRLGSIFGNRISLLLPTKKHALFNKHINNGYTINSSVQLRRIDGNLYLNLFLEKEKPEVKTTGKIVGIDIGIKKLMSTSEGEFFGKEIETKIQKLKRRKRGSHNFKQTIAEIKDYIGQQVNKLKLDDVCAVVLEDLEIQNMSKRGGKSSKEHRRTLGNWNSRLLFGRVNNKCDENRVFVAFIPPEYTSQKCSSCGVVCKESRNGERYECKHCGASLDADYNASINIKNRFLSGEHTVPHEQKSSVSLFNFT